MDIMDEQIEVHNRKMETKKGSNGNLRSEMKWGHNNRLDNEKRSVNLQINRNKPNKSPEWKKIKRAVLTSLL